MKEIKETVANLMVENSRIKKTSKSRFEQNKELKRKAKQLDVVNSRFEQIKQFMLDNDLPITAHEGLERVDFSVFDALRGLIKRGKPSDSVSAEGLYTVKVDGEYKLARIKHYMCWWIMFINDDSPEDIALHRVNVSQFILIELGRKA